VLQTSFKLFNFSIVTRWSTIGYCGKSKSGGVTSGQASIKSPVSLQALTRISIFAIWPLGADNLQFTAGSSMQHRRRIQRGRGVACATDVAKRFTPRHGPSPSFHLCDINRVTSAMAPSNADPRDDSVQVVDDVIDASLIDNAVSSVGAASATESTYTEMDWTSACEELLRTYREKIHPSVCPASKDQHDCADALCRSSIDRRYPTLSNPLRKLSRRSKWLRASTQVFGGLPFAASVFPLITTSSSPSFHKGYHGGRRSGLRRHARRCRGRRGPWSISKGEQILSAPKKEEGYTF